MTSSGSFTVSSPGTGGVTQNIRDVNIPDTNRNLIITINITAAGQQPIIARLSVRG
jgi:hypothetical protein